MNQSLLEKIEREKRRRNQIYITLNYYLKSISYFDFFSKDAFSIVQKSKALTYRLKENVVTIDLLFFCFFDKKKGFPQAFKKYLVEKEYLDPLVLPYQDQNLFLNTLQQRLSHFVLTYILEKEVKGLEAISFSSEVKVIFEKAAENAQIRFKTPVVSAEVLFITLMEEKTIRLFEMLKQASKTETNWYLLRYQLLKEIHFQEAAIRSEVSINQQYFAYLLQTRVSKARFKELIEAEVLSESVAMFRNTLISLTLEQKIFDSLLRETRKSIRFTHFREYSS